MFRNVKPENLPIYLEKIRKLFPEFQDKRSPNVADVKRYYAESFWGYAIFHSWAGAIHLALSPSGKFSKNDYFLQAEEIAVVLSAQGRKPKLRVVEIGCGRAFNLQYLAERFPQDSFIGVDVSERNLRAAKKQLNGLSNINLIAEDFHKLSSIETASVDMLFAVESLCHASNIDEALDAILRVLVPGGRLIVFDGFRNVATVYPEQLRTALRYSEQAMAVPSFKSLEDFVSAAKSRGFCLEYTEDRSDEVMPNLIRLSDFAKGFFKVGPLAKVVMAVVPHGLVANSIAGLLLAVTVKSGAHRYMKLALRRPK